MNAGVCVVSGECGELRAAVERAARPGAVRRGAAAGPELRITGDTGNSEMGGQIPPAQR